MERVRFFQINSILLIVLPVIIFNAQIAYATSDRVIHIKEITRQEAKEDNGRETNKQLEKSVENKVSIGKKSISTLVAPGGSITEALLNTVPGFQAHPVGANSGASRYQIRINGTQVGYDQSGTPEEDGIQILLDGIPLNNPLAQIHSFETNELPISSMFSAINVIQGPGTAENHWYDGMGGTIDFHTVAPSKAASLNINLGGGSFDSYSGSTEMQTGSLAGWKTLFSAGYTRTSGYRTGPTPIGPTQASAFLIKTSKTFDNDNKFTAGLYVVHSQENRGHNLPVYAINGVTVNGLGVPGTLLSESTSGEFYTPNLNLWRKRENYVTDLFYLRLINKLSSNSKLNESIWYRSGDRDKFLVNNYNTTLTSGTTAVDYAEASKNFGARIVLTINLPRNVIKFGGYYQSINSKGSNIGYNSVQHPISPFDSEPVFYNSHTTYWNAANGFIQDRFTPTNWLQIVPGVNIENYNIRVTNGTFANFAQLYPNDETATVTSSLGQCGDFTKIAPSVGMNASILKGVHAFFTWSRNYQTQTGPSYGVRSGAPIVPPTQPAEINSYIGGFKGRYHKIFWQLSGFYNSFNNLAVNYDNQVTNVVTVEPASEILNGVNLLLGYKKNLGFSLYTSDSFQHATESTTSSTGVRLINVPMTGIPAYNIGLTTGYSWFKYGTEWDIALIDRYQSSTYLASQIISAPTMTKLPQSAVNLLNFTFSAKTTLFNHVIPGIKTSVFKFQAYNLLDRKYNTLGYISTGFDFGPSSKGAILAQPGAPMAFYGSVHFLF